MKKYLLSAVAPFALVAPALANETPPPAPAAQSETEAPAKKANEEVFSTGVAKGRDRLDSATSTSALRAADVDKIGARSISEILRAIPGIRAEASTGEGSANITIRGLPIASTGAKFLQLQEDGLPILEFGDIAFATADTFLRADLNLAAVEAIRGGSASTFASNSPGGIVNFISKTGDTDGGAVQLSTGLDYGMRRIDFDYGAHISPTLRFHVGGFYRDGEGPRATGFNSTRGGQIKLNITKEFEGGYIRFYGKYMDDITPAYDITALGVSGTNDKPVYKNIANYDVRHDSLFSRNYQSQLTLDGNNNPVLDDVTAGQHPIVKSIGVESKFEVGGFDITERFRYADMSNHYMGIYYAQFVPAAAMPTAFGVPGGSLRYASGPNVGTAIANPTTLNGNGLGALMMLADTDLNSLRNVTNDIRASRVWNVGGNDLTTTVGLYSSHQTIDSDWNWASVLSGIASNGDAQLLDVVTPTGVKVTQDGTLRYGAPTNPAQFNRGYKLGYTTNAPFASVNLKIGGVAIGGSIRYDFGKASGTVLGYDLGGGRVGAAPVDINRDGVIAVPEMAVAVLPLTRPAPVDYDYGYLSYSAGLNWRIAEPLAVFARYSRGGRANADRIQFGPFISTTDGHLIDKDADVDVVHQAEAGIKYRNGGLTLNVTGFWAKAEDTNLDSTTGLPLVRDYKAVGAEFEGGYKMGIFSLTAGATYTDAEITRDAIDPTFEGNTPQHQAKLIYQISPQVTTDRFSAGAVIVGTTGSYATAANTLKVPGYTTTNAFVQFRPLDRVTLAVNAANLFDVLAITAIDDAVIPAVGVARAHVLNGRTISASVRFDF
ncbi:outer membrane receptor protein involved in Fe transport [Sphingomonas naasensis]|uniref:TonB-dependent receptor n=1 Tax=Sphingomonas naasensis TaxID=1344951 RepID=A0A4V3QXE2_9SPHN|nr:TonB-dependent receptor [Sphingomonas naasensis]NIJ18913.1 outer membrane receptor protein involved in Fe transport [Sphingomonas naasensis]TGX46132.1 TonB-dependent receptor [Sphingomonas naasensis]